MGERINDPSDPNSSRANHDYRRYGTDDDINLLDHVRVVWRYRRLVVVSTVAFTVGAVAWALLATPVYRADVLLAPASDEKEQGGGLLRNIASQYSGLASLAGIDLGGGSANTAEAVATLKSRAFVQNFIEEQQLLPLLFPKRWDPVNKKWLVDDPKQIPTVRDATRLFLESIQQVNVDKANGLVTLSIDWTDRDLASRWANLLVERVNEQLRERAIAQAQASMTYLNEQLAKTSVLELQQAVYRLIEGQIHTIMLANVREQYAFRVIDPAPVLEARDRIRPQRSVLVMVGFLVGGFVGVFAALARNFILNENASL